MPPRLGWIEAPRDSVGLWSTWTAFAERAGKDGLDRPLVCGMGGSSLAPQVLAKSFGAPLDVLDSTDPAAVRAAERGAPLDRRLLLIVSKSGTTVETEAFARYFGARAAAQQLVAITNPGSPLERVARDAGWRATFPHPDVGGRFAALTVVGLLPAALVGIDGAALLHRALALDPAAGRQLGSHLSAAARAGRNKLVLRPPPKIAALGPWLEQLVAESSGKDGKGVLPVLNDARGSAPDREVVSEFLPDPLDLGAEFLRWMHGVLELCAQLGVNPFDQPDVEAAKALARAELAGDLTDDAPVTLTPSELRRAARPDDYVAILAYLPPLPPVAAALERVRAAWERSTGLASTLGFGPRYLHSTGQLHKGGPNTGLFLVITAPDPEDLEIPGMGLTFGRLKHAQALGDVRALLARGRRVAHVHLARWEDADQAAAV